MDFNDKQNVATVINFFWGHGTTTPEGVNEEAAIVAYEALEQAKVCSKSMDLVPRPTYAKSGIKYVLKQLAGIGKRIKQGDTAIYNSCKGVVALRYRTKIAMALNGI